MRVVGFKDSLTVYVPRSCIRFLRNIPSRLVTADGPVEGHFPIKVDGKRHYCTCFLPDFAGLRCDTQLVEHKPEQWAKRLLFMMSMSY